MDKDTFNKYYRHLTQKASAVRTAKEAEYFSEKDVLKSFRKLAAFRDNSTPEAILCLMMKPIQSICDMTGSEFGAEEMPSSSDLWDEKFVDALNYLLKLYASIKEERGE